jgi:hypothetical protein
MGDTFIPGDDLEQLTRMLPQIKQLVSSAKDVTEKYAPILGLGDSQGGIFGDQEVSVAVGVFQAKWSDGDYQLGKEIDNLTGIANNILSAFQQTDQDLLDELEGKTPPDQSGRAQANNSLTLGAPPPKGQVDGRPQPKIG